MSDLLECIQCDTGTDPAGAVIWLHGLGADAHDFEPLVPMLDLNVPLRFIFPNAPTRPVTINGGMEMRAWYDIDPGAPLAGQEDIDASARQIADLVEEQLNTGIPANAITLAGFSQGGVVALHLALAYDHALAGVMALSTYVHNHEGLGERVSFANIEIPIFMAHGLMDPMIPITRAVTSRSELEKLNYQVEWHEYAMGHEVCPEEISDISQWLQKIYP